MAEEVLTVDSRFEPNGRKEAFIDLEKRGFQLYLPPVHLTKVVFDSKTALFETVQTNTVENAVKSVRKEAEKMTTKKWDATAVLETFGQHGKHAFVFLREKFCPAALSEMAQELEKLQSEKNDGRGVGLLKNVVTYLKSGDLESARAVCFNESDKFGNIPDLKDWVIKNLFDGKDHPWASFSS